MPTKMKFAYRGLGVLALFIGNMHATASRAENLAEVYSLSKISDPKHNAARYEFEASGFAKVEARAALLPTLTYERSKSKTDQEILSSQNIIYASGTTKFDTNNETFTLTQPLFKLSSWWGFKQSEAKVRQAVATFALSEQDLILRTTTAYLSVLAARDVLTFNEAEKEAIQRHLDLAQTRYASGLAVLATLHDAKARYAIKEADMVAAQNVLDDMLQALGEITGRSIPVITPLHGDVPLNLPDPFEVNQWIEMAQQKNQLLEARRQAVEVAQQEVKRQRAGHYPVVDIVATSNRRDTGGSLFGGGSDVRTNDIIVRLNFPIYAGGLTSALTGETASRSQVSQQDLERDRRQVERQVRASYQGVVGGVGRVKAYAQSVKSQESARQLKLEGFKSGLETMLAVLDAERDLYAAKRDLSQAQYDLILNGLRLKQAAGTLGEEDLLAVNEMVR